MATAGASPTALSWSAFVWHNLLPVTLGNLVGGSVLVAGFYWAIFLHRTTPRA